MSEFGSDARAEFDLNNIVDTFSNDGYAIIEKLFTSDNLITSLRKEGLNLFYDTNRQTYDGEAYSTSCIIEPMRGNSHCNEIKMDKKDFINLF